MISSLHGVVSHVRGDAVDVTVGGAVGFTVLVPADVALGARVGARIDLHTTLIVREDSLTLFGFADRAEVGLFGILLGVSGVGPKSALGIISHLSVEQIAQAVTDGDDAPFRKVSGIGPKTAKLVVVQLAGKLAPTTSPPVARPGSAAPGGGVALQVTAALVGLGWTERVATEAVERVSADADAADLLAVPALLRLTLAHLGPARGGGSDV